MRKNKKNAEKTLVLDYLRILEKAVNPETANATYIWFSGLC